MFDKTWHIDCNLNDCEMMVHEYNGYSHSLHGATRRDDVVGVLLQERSTWPFLCHVRLSGLYLGEVRANAKEGGTVWDTEMENPLAGFRLGSAKRMTEIISMGPLWFSERIFDVDAYFVNYLIDWKYFYIYKVLFMRYTLNFPHSPLIYHTIIPLHSIRWVFPQYSPLSHIFQRILSSEIGRWKLRKIFCWFA